MYFRHQEKREECPCIDLRRLKKMKLTHRPWYGILTQGMKKSYRRFQKFNAALHHGVSVFPPDRMGNRLIWAVVWMVFIIALLKFYFAAISSKG